MEIKKQSMQRWEHSSRNKIRPQQSSCNYDAHCWEGIWAEGQSRVHSPTGDGKVGNDGAIRV